MVAPTKRAPTPRKRKDPTRKCCGNCQRAKDKTGAWYCDAVRATVKQQYAACPEFAWRKR